MNIKKFIFIVFGLMLAVVLVSDLYTSTYGFTTLPQKREDDQYTLRASSEDQIVKYIQKRLDQNFSNQNSVKWTSWDRTLKISIFPSVFTSAALDAALTDIKYLNEWNDLLNSIQDLAQKITGVFEDNGYYNIQVKISLYDPLDRERLFAEVSKDDVLFDLVAATPAGEHIL